MLTIQPSISKMNNTPAFKSGNGDELIFDPISGDYMTASELRVLNNKRRTSADFSDRYERIKADLADQENEYNEESSFWNEQKQTFDDLAKDDDVPNILKKPMKVLSVVISGILGGMAMVWGSKKSIGAMESLAETKKVKGFTKSVKSYANSFGKAVKDAFGTFKNSVFAKKVTTAYNKKATKFNNSKFGKSKFVKGIKKGFKAVKDTVTDGFNFIKRKIKGIKGEQVKNATVNTLGVSGGVTSGVAAAKEANKSENEDVE